MVQRAILTYRGIFQKPSKMRVEMAKDESTVESLEHLIGESLLELKITRVRFTELIVLIDWF